MHAKQRTLGTFDFLVDRLPFGYAFNFDNYLFNKIKHINTQEIEERADYFIVNNVKKRIEGKIHFLLSDHEAYSPFRSLFGSFEFNPRIHPNILAEFWPFIENDLRARNINIVKITNFAECYSPKKAQIISEMLDRSGFSIYLKAVNHHIAIEEGDLEQKMHPMEVRRLAKCRAGGFTFAQESIEKAEDIYAYLHGCREEQGMEPSITRQKMNEYLELFPQNYLFFTVRDGAEILAATIAIKAHRQVLYNFLPGSLKKHKHYSPTVMLNEGMYKYCQDNGIEMLDLGISTEKDGRDQKSLIAFKKRMGGELSYKYFFEKRL